MMIGRLEEMRKRSTSRRSFKPTRKTVIYAHDDVDSWIPSAVVPTRDQSQTTSAV